MISPEQAKAHLWRRGNLSFKYHSGQKVIEQAYQEVQQKLFVCNISRRFGKTFWAITKAIEVAIKKRGSRIIIASAFQKDIEEFITPLFDIVLGDCPNDLRPTFNSTKKKYRFKNKSEISIVGIDKNPNAGRGRFCDLYIFEEAAFIGENQLEYIYSSVVMPMTQNRLGAKVIMISTPPKSPSHPFKMFCDRAQAEKAYVKLTIFDNPMVTPETIEECRRECLTVSDFEREYMAEFVVDSNSAIVPEFNDKYIGEPPKDEFYPLYHKYVGMDLGVVDKTAMIYAYYDFRRATLFIEDESEMSGPTMTTPVLVELIKAKEKELWNTQKPYKRIADSNNLQLLIDMGSLHGLHFQATGKDTLDAMINELRLMVNAGRIIVSPKCAMLIGCLKYGVFTGTDRKTFARSKMYGHFDHIPALYYLLRNLDKTTNPIQNTYGMSAHSHFIPEDYNKTKNQREISKLFRIK